MTFVQYPEKWEITLINHRMAVIFQENQPKEPIRHLIGTPCPLVRSRSTLIPQLTHEFQNNFSMLNKSNYKQQLLMKISFLRIWTRLPSSSGSLSGNFPSLAARLILGPSSCTKKSHEIVTLRHSIHYIYLSLQAIRNNIKVMNMTWFCFIYINISGDINLFKKEFNICDYIECM